MKKNIHDVIEFMKSGPQGISLKFGIPLRTVYSWCSGERQPPDYLICMMLYILFLERRLATNGNTEEELAEGMGTNSSKIKKACKKS